MRLLFVMQQVSHDCQARCRGDSRCVIVLPCPHAVFRTVSECTRALLFLLSGDVEENPGPATKAETEALLQKVLSGQTAIREDIRQIKESFDKKIYTLSQKIKKN